jgi:hypothetical protein
MAYLFKKPGIGSSIVEWPDKHNPYQPAQFRMSKRDGQGN